ncbi:MAG: phosphoribosylformylglycinamidine synthase subunit PurS, partial [Deltaproteobacteria bacterium]|nr:phosphoribosylformylglycinamidine synthase subunit PurS [Deltaproteobacteria bacterium]
MVCRIEAALKPGVRDARGERIKREIEHFLHLPVEQVRTVDVYTVDADLTPDELAQAAAGPFSDPVIQVWSIDSPLGTELDFAVEVGFRPGVTDNVGRTAREAVEYLTGRSFSAGEGVYYAVQYLISGDLSMEQVEKIATGLLCNTLIQRYTVLSSADFSSRGGFPAYVPKVQVEVKVEVKEIDLEVSDEELMRISKDGVLALTLDEMQIIQAHYRNPQVLAERQKMGLGTKPTDVELECLAQTWSEHCKHKIFAGTVQYEDENGNRQEIRSLFKSFIQRTTKDVREKLGDKDFCLSVFKDNAGVIKFNDQHSLVFKVETHNSPSALDPYGGALTGIVGVNRDPFGTGQGSKLIFNTDVF